MTFELSHADRPKLAWSVRRRVLSDLRDEKLLGRVPSRPDEVLFSELRGPSVFPDGPVVKKSLPLSILGELCEAR